MPAEPDPRVLDFAQLRVTMLADTLRDLVDQIKLTNSHVARLTRDMGDLRSGLGKLRTLTEGRFANMDDRFDRVERELSDLRNDQLLQANQILGAQQAGHQALVRIQVMLESRAERDEE